MKTTYEKQVPVKQIDLRRQALIALSVKARQYRDKMCNEAKTPGEALMWAAMRINDIIAMWYREETGAREFKTFKQWHEEGFLIKKGSKAFVLWAKKRKAENKAVEKIKTENGDPEAYEYEFYPLAYLFSDLQVEKQDEQQDDTVKEIGLFYKRNTDIMPVKITCSGDIEPVLRPFYEETQQIDLYEYTFAVYLNNANIVVGVQKISEGGTSSTVVDIKKIMVAALLQNATGFIMSHNHPTGRLEPSQADKNITNRLKSAAATLDINMLDHIIISSDSYYSFADNGLI